MGYDPETGHLYGATPRAKYLAQKRRKGMCIWMVRNMKVGHLVRLRRIWAEMAATGQKTTLSEVHSITLEAGLPLIEDALKITPIAQENP